MMPRSYPPNGGPLPPPEPSPGNAFTSVRVTRTTDAVVLVEHPEDWTDADVMAALETRAMDFGAKFSGMFWSGDNSTEIDGVTADPPDDPSAEPFELDAEDLGVMVEAPADTAAPESEPAPQE